jgi:DNA polymerase-4
MAAEGTRKIIHVDMDAFYASVEQRNNPELKGKPVVVGGRPDSRGVVSTCSYEARVFGIHSAMPTSEAYRRCPHAVFIANADFSEYQKVSTQVREIFREVTDLIEPLSLDEAYLDVSDNKLNEPSATRLAEWIRRRILEVTFLTASAGVSYNKSLAKIASDWNKPDGLTVITPDMAESFITDLPVSRFWGVGPVTAGRMKELGIHTGGDLRSWPLWKLSDAFGKAGPWYYDLCRGIDNRKVESVRIRKSLGKERTFGEDIEDFDKLAEFLENLCLSVWEELEEKNLHGRTVTIKVKYGDFRQVTRSRSFLSAVQNQELFKQTILELLKETEAGSRPVRLVGASVSSFLREEMEDEVHQLSLDFKTETPGLPEDLKLLREPEALLQTSLSIH